MPINIHRLIERRLRGSIAAAYAAYKFLGARDRRGARPYDWRATSGLHRDLRLSPSLRRLLSRLRDYAYSADARPQDEWGGFPALHIQRAHRLASSGGNLLPPGSGWGRWNASDRSRGNPVPSCYPRRPVFGVWADPAARIATARSRERPWAGLPLQLGLVSAVCPPRTPRSTSSFLTTTEASCSTAVGPRPTVCGRSSGTALQILNLSRRGGGRLPRACTYFHGGSADRPLRFPPRSGSVCSSPWSR